MAEGISETLPADASREAPKTGKTGFKQQLKAVSGGDKIPDQLATIIEEASSRLTAGEITKEQAVDFILDHLRHELLSRAIKPEEVDDAVAFVKEVITDDPAIEMLLTGK